MGLGQQVDQAGRSKKPHVPALLASNEPQRRGQMGLAGVAVVQQDQVLSFVQIVTPGQV